MTQDGGLILESHWCDDGGETGQMHLRIRARPGTELAVSTRLAITMLVRIPPQTELTDARFISRTANYHELQPLKPLKADADGVLWQIVIPRLSHRPRHFTDGPSCAFLILPDGHTKEIACRPFAPAAQGMAPPPATPAMEKGAEASGRHSDALELGLLPAANRVSIGVWDTTPPDAFLLPLALQGEGRIINQLYQRLYQLPGPFADDHDGTSILFNQVPEDDGSQAAEAYALSFSADGVEIKTRLSCALSALIALAQIWHAARKDPQQFGFPKSGQIEDGPMYDWRGMHLDVARQVYSTKALCDMVDCLAWHRFNRFHIHLTDDEGWRLESLAYPQLTEIGAWRGHGMPLLPQHGSGPARHGGFFSRAEMRTILDHAALFNIEIVPEIDVPGHCHAAIVSLPQLLDPSALEGGTSVQGYVNNALNPGLAATWNFLDTIFGEVSDLFPGPYIHIGGDEVAPAAWSGSVAASSWARAKGLCDKDGKADSAKMQASLLRFVANRLARSGKTPLAWEEAAEGGGLDPEHAVLMAWMHARSGPDLASKGYRVILCPGEAYYLDMAQSDRWQEPGLAWAGTSSSRTTYEFEPLDSMADWHGRLLGIQGCIWSETLTSRERFNHMVFPRLSAIAESGWSAPAMKNWTGFSKRAALMPRLPD
ncbi:family 20 glycosylhydrolase [uncultured Cohaesibacter sp.]|uniref:beta-N-acetylhexosaminidase n=1 Tax=uncultured Cohaesibacter sp. TaxID=1002546 RepID=UPI00292E1D4F|nr:family 20 glycosylhydrolase [uncultured Cohaesibacter sp.]